MPVPVAVPTQQPPVLRDLFNSTVSGAAYGLAAVVVSQPFDTVKTKQQAEPRFQQAGLVRTALHTIRDGGPVALYSGFVAAAAGSMLFRAVPFAAYGFSSVQLRQRSAWWESHPVALACVAGSTGGMLRSLLECPLEVVKVRRQVGLQWRWSGLYQGLPVTTARNTSVIGLFWGILEASRHWRESLTDSPTLRSFLAGGGCSTVAWLVVFPLDVLKSRAQAPQRAVLCGGLYAGLGAGLLRTICANGLAMIIYDEMKRTLSGAGNG
jgi:solute carrier family 25 carnitine/acylcarnitine transporter 20/29